MLDWISDNPILFWCSVGISLALSLACFIGVPLLLIRMPSDYFARERRRPLATLAHRPIVRGILLVLKNFLGGVAFIAGVVMLVTPGQGLLFIAIGIALMDIPGKHAAERWIVSRGRLLRLVNKLRAKAGRPPLEVAGASHKAHDRQKAAVS